MKEMVREASLVMQMKARAEWEMARLEMYLVKGREKNLQKNPSKGHGQGNSARKG